MPLQKTKFSVLFEDLTKAIDVDDSAGRSVPINMNFVEEGYLTKDTGTVIVGDPVSSKAHSIFYYKKKNGQAFLIRGYLTKLQVYDFPSRTWNDIAGSPTFTAEAEFGFVVYDDLLYGCNGVENYFRWDGVTFTEYASAPKGNILEIFEDRMFVAGVTAQPLSAYYSNVGDPTTFPVANVLKPLGTDFITNLKNYYGTLLIFKYESVWKLTFVYDQVLTDFAPKLELQAGSYGACSRKAVVPVENDLWFFTGKEVRAIGFQDNITGVFGVNASVISEGIKDTLALVEPENYSKVVVFYEDRRFYLGVPIADEEVDTVFVCHLLYGKSWTKYTGRDKARPTSFAVVDEVIYTTFVGASYGVIKWTVEAADAVDSVYYLTTES